MTVHFQPVLRRGRSRRGAALAPFVAIDIEEGTYLVNGQSYASWDLAWAAMGGTYTRSGTRLYTDSDGLLKTAAANVWPTEYDIKTGRVVGKQIYPLATIRNKWGRDWTNAVWTPTDITVAKDQVGIDGVSNAASSLLATAANGTVFQAITDATSRQRTFQLYIKRLVGTGAISLSTDNGASWTDVSTDVSTAWNRTFVYNTTSAANPTVGIRLATSGDKVAVDFAMATEAMAVPPTLTTSNASESVSADVALVPLATLQGFNFNAGALAVRTWTHAAGNPGVNAWTFSLSDGTSSEVLLQLESTAQGIPNIRADDGGANQTSAPAGAAFSYTDGRKGSSGLWFGGTWALNSYNVAGEGNVGTRDTSATLATPTHFRLARAINGQQLGGGISGLKMWSRGLTDAELQLGVANSRSLYIDGDSLSISTASTQKYLRWYWQLGRSYAGGKPRTVYDLGVGGTTLVQAYTRFQAVSSQIKKDEMLFWTGHNDSDLSAALTALAAWVASMPHDRWAFLTPITGTSGADAVKAGIRDWMVANIPTKTIDVYSYLRTKGDGSAGDNAAIAAGQVPASLLADTIHLNDAGMAHVRDCVAAYIAATGR